MKSVLVSSLSTSLRLSIVLTMATAASIASAAVNDLTLTRAPAGSVNPGNQVVVDVRFDFGSQIYASAELVINFDGTKLTLQELQPGTTTPNMTISPCAGCPAPPSDAGTFTVVGFNFVEATGVISLGRFVFAVKPGATGNANVSIASANINSSVGTATPNALPSTTISIAEQAERRTLTVNSNPSNGGNVSRSPQPGSDGKYANGTVVTLTASPNSGFTFGNWSGGASGSNATTTVTMSADRTVTANFNAEEVRRTLTINSNPTNGGSVSRNPAPGQDGKYADGTVVTLTASPNSGFEFTNWSGGASGSSASVTVTMSANRTVTANFKQAGVRRTLNLSASPANGGSVSASPLPGSDGKYADGAQVIITASPNQGYRFVNWSGAASGTTSSRTVSMDRDRNITANFEEAEQSSVRSATLNRTVQYDKCWKRDGVVSVPGAKRVRLRLEGVQLDALDFIWIGDFQSTWVAASGIVDISTICCGDYQLIGNPVQSAFWTDWFDTDRVRILMDSYSESKPGKFTIARVEYEAASSIQPSVEDSGPADRRLFTGPARNDCERICVPTPPCGEDCFLIDAKAWIEFPAGQKASGYDAELMVSRSHMGLPTNDFLETGPLWHLLPYAMYDEPVLVQVPMPEGLSIGNLDVVYFDLEAGMAYLGVNVESWWVPGSMNEVYIDGELHLEFLVNHGGTFQIVEKIPVHLGASTVDFRITGSRTSWMWAIGSLLLLLVALGGTVTPSLRPKRH